MTLGCHPERPFVIPSGVEGSLVTHARRGTQRCQYRRCYRHDDLCNELCSFFLGHNLSPFFKD